LFILAATTTSNEDLDGIAGYAVDIMDKLGAPGAGLLIALENLFPPLPSEVVLPLAGFTASQGGFSLYSALAWTTFGSIVGAVVLYFVGYWFGLARIRAIADWLPLIEPEDIDKTVAWFNRHGYKAVFFGRMLPIFRSLISIPAGVNRMPFLNFLALTLVGSFIWNSVFVMAGYWLGNRWHKVEPYADTFQKIVIVAVVVFGCWFIYTKVRKRRTAQESAV
jgi:membrane protein DedA with SNARE-associated domain